MIDVYLFLGMLAVQILVLSIMVPRRLLWLTSQQQAHNPPDHGGAEAVLRTLGQYRVANIVVAFIGLAMMTALFSYMRRADWDDGLVEVMMAPYLVLQYLPLVLLWLLSAQANKVLRKSLGGERRTAVLQRRGLFDFVSPVVVVLTLLCYLLYVAFVFYIQRDPFKGFAGPTINIAVVTAQYCVFTFVVYRIMYGRKSNPLQTHAERLSYIGISVKTLVYSCLGTVLFMMTNFSLVLLDRQRLEPLATSIYFVVIALWFYRSLKAPAEVSPLHEAHGDATH